MTNAQPFVSRETVQSASFVRDHKHDRRRSTTSNAARDVSSRYGEVILAATSVRSTSPSPQSNSTLSVVDMQSASEGRAKKKLRLAERTGKNAGVIGDLYAARKLSPRGFCRSKTRPWDAHRCPKQEWEHGMRLMLNGEGTYTDYSSATVPYAFIEATRT